MTLETAITTFLNPLKKAFPVSTTYGAIAAKGGERHYAIDYKAPEGTPVYAPADGKVNTFWNTGGGNMLEIAHAGGITTGVAHLSKYAAGIKPGSIVKRGQLIGYVGQTGEYVTGPHLHFYAEKDGKPFNPLNLFSMETASSVSDYLDGINVGAIYEEFLKDSLKEDIGNRTWGEYATGFNTDFFAWNQSMPTGVPDIKSSRLQRVIVDLGWQDKTIEIGDITKVASALADLPDETDPLTAIAGAVGGIGDVIGAIASAIFDPMFWARVLALIAGSVLVYNGWQSMWSAA